MTRKQFTEKYSQGHKDWEQDLNELLGVVPENQLSVFIRDWIDLWPTKDYILHHGGPSKSLIDEASIHTKMKGFLKTFKANTKLELSFAEKADLITRATKLYINEFTTGQSKWIYIMKAHFFITKNGNSELRSYIHTAINAAQKKTTNQTNSDFKFA